MSMIIGSQDKKRLKFNRKISTNYFHIQKVKMEIDPETNDKIYNLKLKGQNDRDIEIQMET